MNRIFIWLYQFFGGLAFFIVLVMAEGQTSALTYNGIAERVVEIVTGATVGLYAAMILLGFKLRLRRK